MTEPRPSPFSKARLEALSDGVFAIAMTLLVLEIKVPELPKTAASAEILHALREHGVIVFSFVLTFLLSGQFWLSHHIAFHYTKHVDRTLTLLNILFLMFVSLLPFTTALLGAFTLRQPLTLSLYFAHQLILGLLLNAHWWYARRQRLITADPRDATATRFTLQMTGQPIACLVTLAVIATGQTNGFLVFVFAQLAVAALARRRAARLRRPVAAVTS